jgi:quercetin dioxygenase-like cupin family protein
LSEAARVVGDLNAALDELRGAGFRLDSIYPADDPHSAALSRGSEVVRVTMRPGEELPDGLPPFEPKFVLTRAAAGGGEGRAAMIYRNLIPGRLGGRYIASHISIPEGGPVADWVHYHRIALQLIAVRRGWVRVVYEDQGEPFVMRAGDMVLQPPGIRHRVLESSPGLEVVEVSCPALHETLADHDLELPNGADPDRTFGGQRFVRHSAGAPWNEFNGGEAQSTGIEAATERLADVRFVRAKGQDPMAFAGHDGELVFGFVLEGSAQLEFGGPVRLGPADSFVIPPGAPWALADPSPDFRLLHVTTARLDIRDESPL